MTYIVAAPGLEVIKLEFILRLKINRNDWLLADTGLEVIKLEFILRPKIKRNDWLLADTSTSSQSFRFILSLRMNSSFITSRPVLRVLMIIIDNCSSSFFRSASYTWPIQLVVLRMLFVSEVRKKSELQTDKQ